MGIIKTIIDMIATLIAAITALLLTIAVVYLYVFILGILAVTRSSFIPWFGGEVNVRVMVAFGLMWLSCGLLCVVAVKPVRHKVVFMMFWPAYLVWTILFGTIESHESENIVGLGTRKMMVIDKDGYLTLGPQYANKKVEVTETGDCQYTIRFI